MSHKFKVGKRPVAFKPLRMSLATLGVRDGKTWKMRGEDRDMRNKGLG